MQILWIVLPGLLLVAAIGTATQAPPLAGMPYRWGAFVGAIQGLAGLGLLGALLTGSHDGAAIISTLVLLVGFAFACMGILTRRRYGVVVGGTLSLMAILLTAVKLFTSEPEIPPAISLVRIVIQIVFLGVNIDYFSRRWKFMVRPPVQPPPLPKTIPESTVDVRRF